MSIELLTGLARKGVGNYPLVKDSDVQGGLWNVADKAARLAIQTNLRRGGMLVQEADTGDIFQLGADLTTWRLYDVGTEPLLGYRMIYARNTGSDATGDGSLATPFRTLQRCWDALPKSIPIGVQYIINVTGLYNEGKTFLSGVASDTGYGGSVYDPGAPTAPYTPYFYNGAVTIFAEPKLATNISEADANIAAGEITSQPVDPDTGLPSIVTTKTYTVDALKGKFVVDSLGAYAPIHANTASTIRLLWYTSMTAPLKIMEPSAELYHNDGAALAAAVLCELQVFGLKISTGALYSPSFSVYQSLRFGGSMLDVQNIYMYGNLVFFTQSVIRPNGGGYLADLHTIGYSGLSCCALFGGRIDVVNSAMLRLWYNVFEGCSWRGFYSDNELVGTHDMLNCEHKDSGTLNLLGQAQLCSVKIVTLGATPAIAVKLKAQLTAVVGNSPTGIGIVVEPGAVCKVDAATAISGGAGDMKVGDNAANTWPAFRAGTKRETDAALLAVLYQ